MIRPLLISAQSLTAVPELAAAESCGAIAYGIKSNKYGRTWKHGSRAGAERAAIDFCEAAGGRNCQVGVWLEDSCGTLAASEMSKSMNQTGVSWGFSSAAASHARAVAECEARDGAGTCRVIASVCSNGQ